MKRTLILIVILLMFSIGLVLAAGNDQKGSDSLGSDSVVGGSDIVKEDVGSEKGMPDDNKPEAPMMGDEEEKGMGQDNAKGNAVQEEVKTQNMGEEKEIKAQTKEELKAMIQEKAASLSQQAESESNENKKNALKNQNAVRLAVQSLLAMEDLAGTVGSQISTVAMEFNNGIDKTIMSEEKIESRSGFKRFFAGGDETVAEEIEQEVAQNQERIKELKQLMVGIEDEELASIMQEQIQSMEQEQERLGNLAKEEKESKGLFGWMWK